MAVTFLEPGGDATFNAVATTSGGWWASIAATPAVATDFVHGSHIKSIKYRPSNNDSVFAPTNIQVDAGSRVSFYIYLVALPSATATFARRNDNLPRLRLTTAGVLQLWNNTVQIGSNGSTLSTGVWYRISVAYTITSTSVNEFRVFINGVSDISVTNATLTSSSATNFVWGNISTDTTLDFRTSDHYCDDSSTLTDPGNIWVTAKRPNANGTTNGFTTQIGSGGSGYGTGHSPQVNERPTSITNGWSIAAGGVAKTEEYNIEAKATGDINISTATIVGSVGWAYKVSDSPSGGTGSIILNNATTNMGWSDVTNLVFSAYVTGTTYPAGTGTDIGVITTALSHLYSLYDCGVVVAYIPASGVTNSAMLGFF